MAKLRHYTPGVERATKWDFDAKTVPGQWEGLPLLALNETEIAFWKTLPKMGDGESSCLAVAYHRQAIFAADDAKARAVGLRLGMEISGTIGFLLFAIAKKKSANRKPIAFSKR